MSDKPPLTLFLPIINIINHSMASHHANNSIGDAVEHGRCTQDTETKSAIHIITLLERPMCQTSRESLGKPGSSAGRFNINY